jgi:hypothetical protein
MKPFTSRVHHDQDFACWESEHLFGVDLYLGAVDNQRFIPLHQFCLDERPSESVWRLATRWCTARMADNYARAHLIHSDIASAVYRS